MGLELMVGFDNKHTAKYGMQVGVKNESSYPHHVLQMGLYNHTPPTEPDNNFVGVKAGAVNNVEKGSMYGVQLGLWSNTGELRGVQISAISFTEKLYGIQAGVLNGSDGFGFQAGILNGSRDMCGLQVGAINASFSIDKGLGRLRGAQVGAWNYAQDLAGGQAGLVNYVKEELDGLQLGALNIAGDDFNGVQVGLVCYAGNGNYLQLGLLTFRGGERDWYKKFSPVIGFSSNGKKEEAKTEAEPPKEPPGSTKHGTDL